MLLEIIELLKKLILTVLLSSIIGIEREMRHKIAGLRTHILVAVGSCLIVLTSFHVFDIYKDIANVDPTRMITGIVTGIGFLCAGTIIRGGNQVSGLTTAATVWIAAGVGVAVGAGLYSAAILFSVAVCFVLIGVRTLERKLKKH